MSKVLSNLKKYIIKPINQSHKEFYLWTGLRIVFFISTLVSPVVLGEIINKLTDKDYSNLIYYIAVYGVLLLVFGVFLEIYTAKKIFLTAFKVFRDYNYKNFYGKLRNTNTQFWQKNGRGDVAKIIGDANVNSTYLIASFSHSTLWNIFSSFGSLISVFIFDIKYSVFFIIGGFFQVLNIVLLTKKEKDQYKKTNKVMEKGAKILNEYINNFTNVFYLNLFDRVENDLDKTGIEFYQEYEKRENISLLKWFINNFISRIVEICIISYGIYEIVNGNMPIGSLVVLITYASTYSSGISNLLVSYQTILTQYIFIERFDEVFEGIETRNGNHLDKNKINSFNSLVFDNVKMSFDENQGSLEGVSFDIKMGEKVAIIGSSGGGKSTIINLILKSLEKYEGDIRLNDIDYSSLNETQIIDIYSVVPQEVQLFEDTIKNNIIIGKADKNTDLDSLIKNSMLVDLVDKQKDGVDTMVFEGSSNISGGERQRVGIARALAQDTPFLILDEATASLDPITELHVVKNIIQNYNEKSLIFVTHKYGMLDLFDKIILLNEGKIIESGSFKELYGQGGMFKELVDSFSVK